MDNLFNEIQRNAKTSPFDLYSVRLSLVDLLEATIFYREQILSCIYKSGRVAYNKYVHYESMALRASESRWMFFMYRFYSRRTSKYRRKFCYYFCEYKKIKSAVRRDKKKIEKLKNKFN